MGPVDDDLNAPLTRVRLRAVQVATTLGWISVVAVLASAALPHPDTTAATRPAVLLLALLAAVGNSVLALLPWRRLVARPSGDTLLFSWAVGLILLVAALTIAGGGWRSEFYLLFFLVIPFIAITEPRGQQVVLYGLVLGGYLAAVLLAGGAVPAGPLALRLGLLGAAGVLGTVIAQIITSNATSRQRAESAARMERLLADEAHHRIKNNLQLVADLLTLEAGKPDSQLPTVVDETVHRIQSVAAVHQALARRGAGRVRLRPILDRIVGTTSARLAGGRPVVVHGADVELSGDSATWIALAINELVTNALRHGRGRVDIHVAGHGGWVELAVTDEGPGPEDGATGLGTDLIHRLVEEGLHGRTSSDVTGQGYTVRLAIPPATDAVRPEPTQPVPAGR